MTIDKFLKTDLQQLALSFIENRNEKTYAALYAKMRPLIVRYVSTFSLDQESKNEAVTQVMLRAWVFIDKYDPQYNFSTWIMACAKFECFEQLRNLKKQVSIEGSMEAKITLKPVFSEDLKDELEYEEPNEEDYYVSLSSKEVYDEVVTGYIEELKGFHKEMIKDSFFNKLSYEELAEKHDCKLNTVRSRIHNAKKYIRDKWVADKKEQFNSQNIIIENVNTILYA